MHDHIDPVEAAFEELPIGVELEESGMIPAAFASMPSSETIA